MRLLFATAILLSVVACAGAGPTTTGQIDQDIRSETWMRNQMPPPAPGALPLSNLGDTTQTGP